jgi:predicted RNA-binding Zn ribbon-like protein
VTEFRRGLGSLALDFVATVADRPGRRHEKLLRPADLDAWLVGGGLLERVHASAADLSEARELREVVFALVERALAGEGPRQRDRRALNEWAVSAPSQPQLRADWSVAPRVVQGVAGALSAIACDAVDLLGGPDRAKIRKCDRCTLLFIDRSRPGNRRWCSMQVCGNRSKAADFRERHRVTG